MKTHSYTGRISPAFPFLTYLPIKPDPLPSCPPRRPEKPAHPHEEEESQHGSKHVGLEPIN